MTKKPRNLAGPVVRGSDFWGRDEEVEALWRLVNKGNVLITGPRRYGKTSLMSALDDSPREGWTVVSLDVEYVQDPPEFLIEVTAALLEHPAIRKVVPRVLKKAHRPGTFGQWLGGALEFDTGIGTLRLQLRDGLTRPDEWRQLADQLLAVLPRLDGRLLLIIDEFTMMVSNFLGRDEGTALNFLHWFRARRLDASNANFRFLLGGSLNLETRLEQLAKEKVINDLQRFRAEPLERGKAIQFCLEVLQEEGVDFEDTVPEAIFEVIESGVHFYLQVVIEECITECRRRSQALNVEIVRDVYVTRVLGPPSRARFSHFQSRLRERYGELEEAARLLLGELASPTGDRLKQYTTAELADFLNREAQGDRPIEDLLSMLEEDYYIFRDVDRISFSSRFLRDWWHRNVPAPRRLK